MQTNKLPKETDATKQAIGPKDQQAQTHEGKTNKNMARA